MKTIEKLLFIGIGVGTGCVLMFLALHADSRDWKTRYNNLYEQMQNSSHVCNAYEELLYIFNSNIIKSQ